MISEKKKRKSNQSNQALKAHLKRAATVRNTFSMEGLLDLQERPSPLCSRTGDGFWVEAKGMSPLLIPSPGCFELSHGLDPAETLTLTGP